MNPCDPSEHFYLCCDCGSVILGHGECRSCPVETVQVSRLLVSSIFVIVWLIVFLMAIDIALIVGWGDWSHYFSEFGHFLKGGK